MPVFRGKYSTKDNEDGSVPGVLGGTPVGEQEAKMIKNTSVVINTFIFIFELLNVIVWPINALNGRNNLGF